MTVGDVIKKLENLDPAAQVFVWPRGSGGALAPVAFVEMEHIDEAGFIKNDPEKTPTFDGVVVYPGGKFIPAIE